MITRASCLTLALLLAAPLSAASVHLRAPDGTWVEIAIEQRDGIVGFTITPDQTEAGRATVVVNKPDWMVLDDEEPPRVTGYAIGGRIGQEMEEALNLGGLGDEQRMLTVEIADDANPIDTGSARLTGDALGAVALTLEDEDREERSARFALDLGALGPGAYELTLEVADLAPLANTLRLPVRFSISGTEISEDHQTIALSGGGAAFTLRGDRRDTVGVDAVGVAAFITFQPDGEKHLYVHEFASVEDLGEQDGWRLIDAEVALMTIDGDPVSSEDVGASLSFRFGLHADIPALVVRSTATNHVARRSLYCFWGWLPGDGYVTPDGERHEWSESYSDIGQKGWLHLPRRGGDGPGIGWISDQAFGESRFSTMLLYSEPRKPSVDTGESVEMIFAIMPAADLDEVRAVAERLELEGVLELPR